LNQPEFFGVEGERGNFRTIQPARQIRSVVADLRIEDLSREQQELWQRVDDLWAMATERNDEEIETLFTRGMSAGI
jgi:hypothetical protein